MQKEQSLGELLETSKLALAALEAVSASEDCYDTIMNFEDKEEERDILLPNVAFRCKNLREAIAKAEKFFNPYTADPYYDPRQSGFV